MTKERQQAFSAIRDAIATGINNDELHSGLSH